MPRSTVISSPSTVSVLTPSRVSTWIGSRAVDEAVVDEVASEEPDAVAAHLRERAVGVAVVHEPGGLGRARPQHPQHAVTADAGAAVAQRPDAILGQLAVDRAVRVGQQDEVVLGAVTLEELVGHQP